MTAGDGTQRPAARSATRATTTVPRAAHGPHGADGHDPRLGPLTAALVARLRPACRDWDAAAFDALIEQIARTKLRWVDLGYDE